MKYIIGLGLLADGLGRAYFAYLEYNGQLNPTSTYADIGLSLFYPFVFAGLILMLIGPKPGRVCVRMGLDVLITTLCILGVNWYFFIDPTFLLQSQAHVTTARLVSVLSYPFWDFLLILAIVLIIRHCAEHIMKYPPRRSILLQIALLFFPLGILLALTLGSEVRDDKARALFLLLLTALVGIVVAVRYLLTTHDNELLLQERERQLQETERLYQHLQTAHQHLRELDQLKDQFLMTASHELRTPLTSVQGYLGLMAQFHDQLPPKRLWEYLQKAQRSCDVLVMLLSNIMDASHLEVEAGIHPAHLEQVSVQDMMQSVINLIEPHVTQEQREVHLHIPPHLYVRADAGQLRQVLLNISMNALKYSPPRTPIAFSARVATDFNSEVVISVTDKGPGIAPGDQARIFQRFVRLEREVNSSVPGSGLGLYISYHLVEAMGGKIWIESNGIPGEGTAFHIQLSKA